MVDSMMKTTVLLVIDHTKPIPELLKLVEGRVYNLDKVEDAHASEVTFDEVLQAYTTNVVQPA